MVKYYFVLFLFLIPFALGVDKTISANDNTAFVDSKDIRISIDKFTAKPNDRITLDLNGIKEIKKICFEFPVNTSFIEMNEIKISVFLLPDINLKNKEEKSVDRICYDNVFVSNDKLYFKPIYTGPGIIKYNITFDDVVMDPYLIGTLATSNRLLLYLPFNNNSDIQFASKEYAFNSSHLRFKEVADGIANSTGLGWAIDPVNIIDSDYSTYSECSFVGYNNNNCSIYLTYNKNSGDTGALWQVKDLIGLRNLSIPSSCFTFFGTYVWLQGELHNRGIAGGVDKTQWLCYNGVWVILSESDEIGTEKIYEEGLWITNDTTYSAYDTSLPESEYININGLVSGYLFNFPEEHNTTNQFNFINSSHKLTSVFINYSDSGAYFNGISTYLNTTLNITNINHNISWCSELTIAHNSTSGAVYGRYNIGSTPDFMLFARTINGEHYLSCRGNADGLFQTEEQPISLDTEYNICCTANGTASWSDSKIYINGDLKSSDAFGGVMALNQYPLFVGRGQNNNYFNGTIKNILLYNRTLSATEISQMYHKGNFTKNLLNETEATLSFNNHESVYISNTTELPLSISDLSICAWVKQKYNKNNSYLFFSEGTGTNNLTIVYGSNYISAFGAAYYSSLDTTQWHYLCSVLTTGLPSLYLDSILVNQSGSAFNLGTSRKNIKIGVNPSNYSQNFEGELDEFMIFNYNLSLSEIQQLYQGYALSLDNCSKNGTNFLDITAYDEESKLELNANIEIYVNLSSSLYGETYNLSYAVSGTGSSVCINNINVTGKAFKMNSIIKYSSPGYVTEYYYLDNFSINSIYNMNISLYDLNETDSTSFLVTYQDRNYIYVEGAVIDLQRKYVGDNNVFLSVEHGKTDSNGQTRLHLVTEDVIYKFNVWKDNILLFSSPEYLVLCQAVPCQINLRDNSEESVITSVVGNLVYSITNDSIFKNSRTVTFSFSSTDGSQNTILLNLTRGTQYLNETICNVTTTTSSGALSCTVPVDYSNTTYTARVYKNGQFIGVRAYSLIPDASDNFGDTGLFLTAIGYVSLALMAIASPIFSVVLGIFGLVIMTLVNLFDGGSLFGVGSTMIWLIIAAGIIIWKFNEKGAG